MIIVNFRLENFKCRSDKCKICWCGFKRKMFLKVTRISLRTTHVAQIPHTYKIHTYKIHTYNIHTTTNKNNHSMLAISIFFFF